MLRGKFKYTVMGISLGLVLSLNNYATAAEDSVNQMSVQNQTYSLKFNKENYTSESKILSGEKICYRAYRKIVYVEKPLAVNSQVLNIFIPEPYFENKTINGYTAKSAPIFMPNTVGGYMPGQTMEPVEKDKMTGGANSVLLALKRGYVVVTPAIRGRTTIGDDGKTYVGKAPAFIVDYKAAVRYLRYNSSYLPAGNTEKIISNGTSAGGALSALLGASGNAREFEPYLKALGAADERDDIFASSDYCPITNLEHADMAYEWIFSNETAYRPAVWQLNDLKARGVKNEMTKDLPPSSNEKPDADAANHPVAADITLEMTDEEKAISEKLALAFPSYVNSLSLKSADGTALTLDKNGNGTFKDYIKHMYQESAREALENGYDMSNTDWVILKNGQVSDIDLERYTKAATRMKAAPAFDKMDLSSAENDEFGTLKNEPRHFSKTVASYLGSDNLADRNLINLMNPLYFIRDLHDKNPDSVKIAPHYRIRHGSIDRDTSIAIPAILALSLENRGIDVNFFSPWNRPHSGDYDLDRLFDWIDSICK